MADEKRYHDYGCDRKQDCRNPANCECKRDEVQFDEAAFLFLFVDDIERIENCLHSRIGAPQREGEPGDEAEPKSRTAFLYETVHLFLYDVGRAGRQESVYRRQMLADCRGRCEQAIQRDESCYRRKERQKPIEDYARGNGEQTIVAGTLVRTPQDVFPAPERTVVSNGLAHMRVYLILLCLSEINGIQDKDDGEENARC
jgi:hypothetical protein